MFIARVQLMGLTTNVQIISVITFLLWIFVAVFTLRDICAGGYKAFSAPCLNDIQGKKGDPDTEKADLGLSNSDEERPEDKEHSDPSNTRRRVAD